MPELPTDIQISRLTGSQITPHLPDLARLRITVFREFPYLYDGDPAYEERYLATYSNSPHSLFVLAWHADQIIGASTGVPLPDETAEVQQPFREQGYDLRQIFYFGESVLLPAYRGRGIGVRFFTEREAYARSLHARYTTFCAVDRPTDHPRRPPDYVPLDAFWQRRGYTRQPALHTTFRWQDLDEVSESPKPMTFWLKPL